MSMGKKIAALRKAAGMTQMEMAQWLRVSRQAVSKWEQDLGTPEIGNILAIAELFQVSVDELTRDVEGSGGKPKARRRSAVREEAGRALRRLRFGLLAGVLGIALGGLCHMRSTAVLLCAAAFLAWLLFTAVRIAVLWVNRRGT